MRLILFHSITSGSGKPSGKQLRETFEKAGHEVEYVVARSDGWKDRLDEKADAVVAAGGDGTVRKIALALARACPERPMAIVPLGTSNNVAGHFGIRGSPAHIAEALHHTRSDQLAIGLAKAEWGKLCFVESAGVGLFGGMMHSAGEAPDEQPTGRAERIRSGFKELLKLVRDTPLRRLCVFADDEDLSGEYFMVEAMNLSLMGFRLKLAPLADAGGPTLTLVRCGEPERAGFVDYLQRRLAGEDDAELEVPNQRAHRIRIEWPARLGHADDKRWPEPEETDVSEMVKLKIKETIPLLVTRAPDA